MIIGTIKGIPIECPEGKTTECQDCGYYRGEEKDGFIYCASEADLLDSNN